MRGHRPREKQREISLTFQITFPQRHFLTPNMHRASRWEANQKEVVKELRIKQKIYWSDDTGETNCSSGLTKENNTQFIKLSIVTPDGLHFRNQS